MKRTATVLILLIALTLGACNLRAPGGDTPTATISEPDSQEPSAAPDDAPDAAPGEVPTATLEPTAAPPTEIPPTEVPPTEPPPAEAAPTQGAQAEAGGQPTATPPPAPTATTTPGKTFDPRSVYGDPTYENPMTIPNYWEWASAGTDTLPNNKVIQLQFKDGNLYVTGKKVNFSTWWFSGHYLKDAYTEMTYDTENCSGNDAYGMIVRGPKHGAGVSYGYIVSFTCNGNFSAFRLDSADPWDVEELVDVQENSAINTGSNAENVIGVRAVGNKFTVYANGIQVAQFEDDHFEKGRVGVFVRAAKPDAYTYRVKNFAFWTFEE